MYSNSARGGAFSFGSSVFYIGAKPSLAAKKLLKVADLRSFAWALPIRISGVAQVLFAESGGNAVAAANKVSEVPAVCAVVSLRAAAVILRTGILYARTRSRKYSYRFELCPGSDGLNRAVVCMRLRKIPSAVLESGAQCYTDVMRLVAQKLEKDSSGRYTSTAVDTKELTAHVVIKVLDLDRDLSREEAEIVTHCLNVKPAEQRRGNVSLPRKILLRLILLRHVVALPSEVEASLDAVIRRIAADIHYLEKLDAEWVAKLKQQDTNWVSWSDDNFTVLANYYFCVDESDSSKCMPYMMSTWLIPRARTPKLYVHLIDRRAVSETAKFLSYHMPGAFRVDRGPYREVVDKAYDLQHRLGIAVEVEDESAPPPLLPVTRAQSESMSAVVAEEKLSLDSLDAAAPHVEELAAEVKPELDHHADMQRQVVAPMTQQQATQRSADDLWRKVQDLEQRLSNIEQQLADLRQLLTKLLDRLEGRT